MSILERIHDERVFQLHLSDDKKKLMIFEMCDQNFEVELTKYEARKMIIEIS